MSGSLNKKKESSSCGIAKGKEMQFYWYSPRRNTRQDKAHHHLKIMRMERERWRLDYVTFTSQPHITATGDQGFANIYTDSGLTSSWFKQTLAYGAVIQNTSTKTLPNINYRCDKKCWCFKVIILLQLSHVAFTTNNITNLVKISVGKALMSCW